MERGQTNKRRSGIAESSNARRSDEATTTAQGLEWNRGVAQRRSDVATIKS